VKITREQYSKLKAAIDVVIADSELSLEEWKTHFRDRSKTMMAMRWTLFHHTGDLYKELYASGLDDSHIDTALRKITATS
jgi:hypothetical protein